MEVKDWFQEGYDCDERGEYQQAIDCYNKAIELDPEDADTYNNKGIALKSLGEYQQAIDCYDKAIKLKPDDLKAYYNKGDALRELGDHQQAIDCYDKAIELTPDYADAYNNKGIALHNLGEYQQAIDCYDRALELRPDDANVYNNKGYTLYKLSKYEQSIDWYNKAIELDPNVANTHNNRRILLRMLEEKKQNNDFPEELKDTYLSLYDSDFFNKATNCFSNDIKQHYETIYFLSLKILNILQIKEEDKQEKGVAHYTTKKVSQILLFDKEKSKDEGNKEDKPIPFQLSSVTNSNDIQEGKTLFNYLFDNQKMCPQSEKFVAFVGCFMFNFDNLNQFRLYGKDRDTKEEGTGISIVMKSDFFSLVGKSPIQQEGRQISQDDPKAPLFRCIYIDPETSQVVSIGHRDFHTFYKKNDILYNRKNKEDLAKEITKEITKYKEEIDKKIENVRGYLEDLKEEINKAKDQGLEESVICDLLLNLRYLVKHVAFKEEQECRIVMIKRPCDSENEQPIDEDVKHQRFYVNYLPLGNYVKKIFFGPKAAGMELFQSLLTYQKGFEDVICYRSTSPLA